MLHRLFLLLFLSLSGGCPLGAQQHSSALIGDYWTRNFTDENGLPQNSVKDLVLDASGFLWMTTESGIVRFDGKNFRTFSNNNTTVTSNRFRIFAKPLSGMSDEFYAPNNNAEVLHIRKGRVKPVALTKEFTFREIPALHGKNIDWHNGVQYNFWKPEPGSVFLLSIVEKKYSFFTFDKDSIRLFDNGHKVWQIAHQLDYYGDFFHFNGQLYYANRTQGIQHWTLSGPKHAKITGDIKNSASGIFLKVYNNNNISQTFGYADNCLYLLSQTEPGILHARLLMSDINLDSINIATLLFDEPHKRLFIGSYTKGLYVFSKKYFSVLRETPSGSGKDNVYYAQAVLDSHTVITPQGTILGLDPASGKVIAKQSKTFRPTLANRWLSCASDNAGNIWIKDGNLLTLHDRVDQKELLHYTLPAHISRIKEGMDNNLWIGTSGDGLYSLDQTTKTMPQHFLKIENTEITCMAHENKNVLWVGTDKGLYRVALLSKALTKIEPTDNIYIRSLYISGAGEIWITTYDSGFYLFKDDRLTQFLFDKKHYLQNSHCIVEDTLGYFWISTNKGLFQLKKKDLLEYARSRSGGDIWYNHYLSQQGFNTNEFNGGCEPCAVRLPSGYVSFPSMDGLVWFKPEETETEPPTSNIFVDKIEADGQIFDSEDEHLNIPFSPGHLRLDLSIPYYGTNQEIMLQYALVNNGLPDDYSSLKWTPTGANDPAAIQLFNISPGNHTLLIKKVNGFGSDNNTYKKLYLSIPYPWYRTSWGYAIFSLVFLAVIFLITRMHNLYLQRKNRILEEAVAARTSALTQLLGKLEISRENLEKQSFIKEQIIASISHDIKTPLRFLIRLNETLFDRLSSQENEDSREICKASYETGKSLDSLLSNLLEYVKTNPLKTEEIASKPIHLYTLVEEKISLFKSAFLLKQSETLVNNDVGRKWTVYSDYHLLGIIIQNLLDNSVKAASKGFVSVFVDKDSNSLVFHNTGYPMPVAISEWVNSKDLGLVNERRVGISPQNGIGLLIVKQIANLLDLPLKVESSSEHGTFFYVKFPTGMTET